jgi:hypothetical protein
MRKQLTVTSAFLLLPVRWKNKKGCLLAACILNKLFTYLCVESTLTEVPAESLAMFAESAGGVVTGAVSVEVAGESVFRESLFASVPSPLLQAVIRPATATIAKNFFMLKLLMV